MTTKTESVAQITATAITLLSRELGVVNTARFFNQFTMGFGDYTAVLAHLTARATRDGESRKDWKLRPGLEKGSGTNSAEHPTGHLAIGS